MVEFRSLEDLASSFGIKREKVVKIIEDDLGLIKNFNSSRDSCNENIVTFYSDAISISINAFSREEIRVLISESFLEKIADKITDEKEDKKIETYTEIYKSLNDVKNDDLAGFTEKELLFAIYSKLNDIFKELKNGTRK